MVIPNIVYMGRIIGYGQDAVIAETVGTIPQLGIGDEIPPLVPPELSGKSHDPLYRSIIAT